MMNEDRDGKSGLWKLLIIFLRLGFTSFGGPIAHLGYFRDEFVVRREWLTEKAYAELVALCQFLPGPTSSQVGFAIGLLRGGYAGGLLAWLGFTLPSAVLMLLFAWGVGSYEGVELAGVLHGLKVVAVAIVAQAVWEMGRKLCPDVLRAGMMAVACCIVLMVPHGWVQLCVIVAGGVVGAMCIQQGREMSHEPIGVTIPLRVGTLSLLLFLRCWRVCPFWLLSSIAGH